MKPLQPFEFTPSFQKDADDPVVFVLKPLDFQGQYLMNIARVETESGLPGFTGLKCLPDYIVSWKGGGMEFSGNDATKEIRRIVNGGPDMLWVTLLTQIMNRLLTDSAFSEDEEKKS